ncbi:MAG: replication factor C large subunit, partial [Nanoarchaeota archaeon]
MFWVDKYKPKSLKEIQGQDSALLKLKHCVLSKKPALVYGAVGSGKTSSVYALAYDLDYETLEVNASDQRNSEQVENIIGNSLKQQSLFNRDKIILIDEVDGIAGNQDRGGISALTRLLLNIAHPVVLIANDPWDIKLMSLRNKCELIEFRALNHNSIAIILKKICGFEGINYKDDGIKKLAMISGGDLRAAINDLQILTEHSKVLSSEDIDFLGERERESSIFNLLMLIFKSKNIDGILKSLDNVDMAPEDIIMWIDENLAREYSGKDLERAYDMLSKADVFRGRIRRQQYWRFLVYINSFLGPGVALSKERKEEGFVQYKKVSRIFRYWQLNQKYAIRKGVAKKLSYRLHMSSKKTIKDVIPYMKIIAKNNKNVNFGLDEEEVEWL